MIVLFALMYAMFSLYSLYVQISPVAEVQAPVKDAGCDKEGALTKDGAANATEVGMGTSDSVGCFSSFTGFAGLSQKMKIHCCSASLTAEDFIEEVTFINCLHIQCLKNHSRYHNQVCGLKKTLSARQEANQSQCTWKVRG